MANYRYFVSSGPERYLFNITDRLGQLGHDVVPFSIRYSQNIDTPYAKYFADPIGGEDEVFFDQHRRTLKTTLRGLSRLFHANDVERAIIRLIEDTRPDLAYVLYYLRKLSPSLLTGIKKTGIPLVVRISDYGMMCGEHHMLREDEPCTQCIDGSILSQVRNKCIKHSLALSAIDALATSYHRNRGYFDLIDRFVTTNPFMTDMMVRAGFDPGRIECIPTFTDMNKFRPSGEPPADPPYFVYVGRLDRPKGIHVAIEAMGMLRARLGDACPRLRIAGVGHTDSYVESLHRRVAELDLQDHVLFLGGVPAEQVPALFQSALAAVMPALWYENLPNSVVEAFACGCPVITSRIGSLARTVTDGVDGLHAEPGDATAFADALFRLTNETDFRKTLAQGALHTAQTVHAPDVHVQKLLSLFNALTSDGQDIHSISTRRPITA